VNEPEPYLSIVLTGRNDNHGGDFNERFFRALRFNRELLDAAGLDYELVFVEWAPLRDRPYLAELLIEQMPDPARLTVYIVDPRYQDAFVQNPKLRFMEFVAKNVGIRRAQGAFILTTNTDIFLSAGVVERLAGRELEANTLYRAMRADVRLGTDLSHADWALLEDPRNHGPSKPIRPPLYAGATGDFLLLDRASYHRLRGFNEVYRCARIGIDANFLVKVYANGYRITDIGAPVYHVNHVGSYRITKSLYRTSPADAPWGDERWHPSVVYENPESWGLEPAPCRELGARVYALDFSWEAVPPLVDLQRVLVPAARLEGIELNAEAEAV
jgi:hypothetical protein